MCECPVLIIGLIAKMSKVIKVHKKESLGSMVDDDRSISISESQSSDAGKKKYRKKKKNDSDSDSDIAVSDCSSESINIVEKIDAALVRRNTII